MTVGEEVEEERREKGRELQGYRWCRRKPRLRGFWRWRGEGLPRPPMAQTLLNSAKEAACLAAGYWVSILVSD